ncbi:MAG: pantoate--beta-alanine ligase [Chloroflexi bacterium]|nr:pantoate--beta-alanine ligase [Chloroflexota bacterium]
MQVLDSIQTLREALGRARRPLGLVPTMGYLHEGHLSLVRRARAESATAAVSIFVNPTQFGPQEDLTTYPRDLSRDLALLEKEGVDIVFAPSLEEIYPRGFDTWVHVDLLARRLEGEARPGHFRGVCTVVLKLFYLFRPERAYFGQKDAQQALVVQRMARDLNTGTEVVVCPTLREPDGLAMSSRNVYLDHHQRRAATVLYRSLCLAQEMLRRGERDADKIRTAMMALLQSEPLVSKVEYVSIADKETLKELEHIGGPALVSLAVRIGRTRLIDNVTLTP